MAIYLNKNVVNFVTFPNKEKRLDLELDFLKETNEVIWKWQDDSDIFELFLFDSVMNKLKENYTLFIPYMPYSRMDRVEKENTAFSLDTLTRLFAQQLKAMKDVQVLDPHSPETLNLMIAKGIKAKEYDFSLAKKVLKDIDLSKVWIVFPDKGASIRYNADDYENVIVCKKTRDFSTGKILSIEAEILKSSIDFNSNETIYIIDDLCSYGGTFVGCLAAIERDLGKVKNAHLIITHSEEAILKGEVLGNFDTVYTTDSLSTPIRNEIKITKIEEIF